MTGHTLRWTHIPSLFYEHLVRYDLVASKDNRTTTMGWAIQQLHSPYYEGWIDGVRVCVCGTPEQAMQFVEDIIAIRVNSTGQTNSG